MQQNYITHNSLTPKNTVTASTAHLMRILLLYQLPLSIRKKRQKEI